MSKSIVSLGEEIGRARGYEGGDLNIFIEAYEDGWDEGYAEAREVEDDDE